MNLTQFSIKNPVFAWMLMIGLMLFGFVSFKSLGVGQMPDVDFPVLTVQLTWEGAAPEVMESDAVDLVEDVMMGVEGIKDISSSSRQGHATITAEFNLGRDIDAALQEVQSKIAEVQYRLPKDMDSPVIAKFNPEDQPIMWIAVSSDTKSRRELMEYVDRSLKDVFKTVPGVGEVMLGGYLDPNLRIWLDTKKMDEYQVTVEDVIDSIAGGHLETPAGYLETARTETTVRAMGEARSVEEFEKIIIEKRAGKAVYKSIPLKAVARIEDGLADIRSISRVMGKISVGLGIRKQRGTNTVAVAKGVKKKLEIVKRDIPKDYEIGINFDSTKFIEESVHELVFTLILSSLLTAFVCWLFLGSWTTTLNILLAIPTSLLGTFIVMKFAGFTMNTFTLLGLSLAVGIVVDDAIMVLENIVRHSEMGKDRKTAALDGTRQITGAAVAATIAIAAIFIPVVYMDGIIGKFFMQFGVTITAAVLLSLLEAVTLAPMRCSRFLEHGNRNDPFGKWFEKALVDLSVVYSRILDKAIKHRRWVFGFAALIFVGSFFLLPHIRKEFVPAQDQSMMLIRVQTPIDSSMEYTSEKMKEVEKLVMDHPSTRRYYCAVGGFSGGETNAGMLFVSLKEPKDRPKDAKLGRRPTQDEVMEQFRESMKSVKDIRPVLQDLSLRGFSAQRGFPVEFTVRGPNWDTLVEASEKIQAEMRKSDLLNDVDTDYLSGKPEIRVYPDRDKAYEHGVSVSTIATTINALIGGERVAKYTKDGRRYDVRVKLEATERVKADNILDLNLWNNRGELVRMRDVVKLEEKPSLLVVTRKGRERAIGIFSNVAAGKSQALAIEQAREIAKKHLPPGYRAVFSGTSETFKESFQSLMIAFWLGIIVGFMVLASQYNHVIHPITIYLALPFSLTGAFFGLWVTDQSLNIFSFIGLLLLMGIVKKNSIMLVEFMNQLREDGKDLMSAVREAAPVRLRPILMTTVATVAAAVPPALAIGPGAETRIPMAVVVIGGVTVSAILTLFVVPCAYISFAHLEEWFGKLRRRKA
ncbi:MAG TPA: efflux RND transporter permease subunit [Candidatus Omnitrophota bacterium]|nr:efflux RND transporter permease subunit [Candidatus Omnitrophota bacterium]